jgi:hypothetical protein
LFPPIQGHFTSLTCSGQTCVVRERVRSAVCGVTGPPPYWAQHSFAFQAGGISAAFGMFVTDAAAIRTIFHQEGELSAAIELRRRFQGTTGRANARACLRRAVSVSVGNRIPYKSCKSVPPPSLSRPWRLNAHQPIAVPLSLSRLSPHGSPPTAKPCRRSLTNARKRCCVVPICACAMLRIMLDSRHA